MSGAREIIEGLIEDHSECLLNKEWIDKALADLRALVEWPEEMDIDGMLEIYGRGHQEVCIAYGKNQALKLCKEAVNKAFD